MELVFEKVPEVIAEWLEGIGLRILWIVDVNCSRKSIQGQIKIGLYMRPVDKELRAEEEHIFRAGRVGEDAERRSAGGDFGVFG